MNVDALEKRLHELEIETPDAGRVSARILARQVKRSRLAIPRLVTVPAALALLVALVVYFVPVADLAIADKAPWGGEVLQWAGLVGAKDRITVVNSSVSSSGYTLTLQGAYADSTRTVLLMHIDPVAELWVNANITDQFFRSYRPSGGSENLLTGDMSMQFEPLAWPDSISGARITLHVPQLETQSHEIVAGSWDLTATLGMDVAKSLRAPAPGDLGPAHFSFTSVSYTPATIEVDIHITGVPPDDLSRMVPGNGGKEGPALQIEMLDPGGQIINGNGASSQSTGATDFHLYGFRVGGAGEYVVRVSYYGYGSFDRMISIPS